MKLLLIIFAVLATLSSHAQQRYQPGDTILVSNNAWDCGDAIDVRPALVQTYNGKLCIRFEFDEISLTLWNIKKALRYWEGSETKIVGVRKKKNGK